MLRGFVFFLSIIFSSVTSTLVFAEADLQGTWALNEAASDSVKNKIAGVKSKRKKVFGQSRDRDGRRAEERGSKGRGQQLGPLRKILSAETVRIDGKQEIELTFDDEVVRSITPNRYGRVFSASGKELVKDKFGHTLSYWDAESLVVETMMARGGIVIERYQLNEDSTRLVVAISIKTLQSASIEISKVFERSTN